MNALRELEQDLKIGIQKAEKNSGIVTVFQEQTIDEMRKILSKFEPTDERQANLEKTENELIEVVKEFFKDSNVLSEDEF